jgi:glycosyltransferase 2 family protein
MLRTEGTGPRLRRWVRPVRVVLAVAIVALLLHWVGPAEVRDRFAACPPQVALGCLAAALLGQWLGALRFQRLAHARGLALSRLQALAINLASVFYGLFLPGGTATSWLVRLLRLPEARQRPGLALTIIAGDRAFATVAGALIGVTADLALRSPVSPAVSVVLALVALVSGLVGWGLLTPAVLRRLVNGRGFNWLRRFAARVPHEGGGNPPPATPALAVAATLSMGVHGLGILAWWALARGLGLDLGVLEIAWVRSAALVVGLLPVTVGGLGLREGAVVALLAVLGVSSVDALSLSLLAFTVTVLGVGVVGGIVEASQLMRRR